MLAKLDTFSAALLAIRPSLSMLWLDALSVRAVVVIVIHVPMRGWVFFRVRVVRVYFCHSSPVLPPIVCGQHHLLDYTLSTVCRLRIKFPFFSEVFGTKTTLMRLNLRGSIALWPLVAMDALEFSIASSLGSIRKFG